MKKSLVITTIFPPRPDVYAFAKVKDISFIAVGDKKTPPDWNVKNVQYISPSDQEKQFPTFSKVLPWNIYARKNMGYLIAMKEGSDLIAETDDDVTPYPNYSADVESNVTTTLLTGEKFINIYPYFGGKGTWPRGYPLSYLTKKAVITKKKKLIFAPLQNSVIDQDSDFDAIYRLISDKPVKFKKFGSFALDKGSYCPVNSQNTFFHKEIFELMYIPSFVNPRVEDILRGYIAQRILWEIDARLVFTYTTTYTKDRNAHNYLEDFEREMPLYLKTEKLILLLDSLSLSKDMGKSLITVYQALAKEDFVGKKELPIVKQWVKEVEKLK